MGLQSLIPQTGGSAAWGGIGGTLADQTDLSAALGLRALLTANTFTGAQTLPAGVGLLPASSGGTNLGQYNLGFGTLRVRTVEAESGSGNSSFYLNQDFGILCGASGYIGFATTAASGPTQNDAFFTRSEAAHIKMGKLHATTPTNQTFSAHNVTTGTGAALTLAGGTGTTTPGSQLILGGGIGGTGASTITAKVSSGGATTTIFTVAEDGITIGDNLFINAGTTSGLTIASSTSQKLGFWGTSPAVQGAAITDVSSAPSVTGFDTVSQANLESVLASYGTAINDILTRLRNPGFIAT